MKSAFLVLLIATTSFMSAQSMAYLRDSILTLDGIGGKSSIYLSKGKLMELDSLYLLNVEQEIKSYEIDIIKHRSTVDHHMQVSGNRLDEWSKEAIRSLEVPFIVIIGGSDINGDEGVVRLNLTLKIYVLE